MSNVSVFAPSACVVYTNKKGDLLQISPEGALFKGGAAIASLKDAALESAMAKAVNGRYGGAADILEVAFPAVGKAVRALLGTPSANKASFVTLLGGIERADEPAKGWSKKQLAARSLVRGLRTITALAREDAGEVVEAA